MFGECRAPCTLKTSFVDFRRVGALLPLQKTKLFVPTKLTILFFSGSQQSLTRLTHPVPHLYYIIERVLVLNIAELLIDGRSAKINQEIKPQSNPVGYIKPNCASMCENSQLYSRVVDNQEMCQIAVASIWNVALLIFDN